MVLLLSCVIVGAREVDPPGGSLSPLAWLIIVALSTVCATVIPVLWHRGNKIQDRADENRDKMYEDLKACNEKRAEQEEEILGLLKVLSLSMEQSKGGKR